MVTLRDQPQYREAAMCKAGCLCSLGCVALPCRCGLTHGTVIYLFIFFLDVTSISMRGEREKGSPRSRMMDGWREGWRMATMENLEARRSLGRACRLLFYAPHLPHLPTSMPVSMSAFGDSARRPRPCVERNGARLSSVVSCRVVPYRIPNLPRCCVDI